MRSSAHRPVRQSLQIDFGQDATTWSLRSHTFTPSQDFKVIQCENGQIIPAPAGCRYAALSYVWGDIQYPDPSGYNKFPRVVEDSMKVAFELGCKYLWVDRHCINQQDPEKKKLIQRMDEVYSQADFTIIDAAGTDCTHGLAGVSIPRRPDPAQASVQVNRVKLTYLGTPPGSKVKASRWASRGWTYQEGVLSHKRIFFTDEQVIFQCNTMTCQESVSIHKNALHKIGRNNDKKQSKLEDIEPISLIRGNHGVNLGDHLMEFSGRDLTNDKDSLDAFLGILNVYHKAHGYVHFLRNPLNIKGKPMINTWYHPEPGIRKSDFPSWSWTGWKGAIKMTSYQNPDSDIRLVTTTGDSISIDDYIKLLNKSDPRELKPIIKLEGRMTKLWFKLIKWALEPPFVRNRKINEPKIEDGPWAILPLTNEFTCYSFLYLDNEALTGLCEFQLPVIVLEIGSSSGNKNTNILVLREKGANFEHVGLIPMRHPFEPDNEKWNAAPKPTVYKRRNGKWMTKAPIPKPEDHIWLQEAKRMTITLQ
ncbi:hypothetical protein FSPOR_7567 [Fusarium sporotrichioides]|uniref:Heterokaryon incompatibility domain-containing protein n=1 Tax=Fusarium sporotrichioides TaxID=5514 RepID=A0A395RXR8_FUSSP|nr:hypothetical protein FSPOR_7567 [Fusarium sporotrichioides]